MEFSFLSDPRVFAVNRMEAHSALAFNNPEISLEGEWDFRYDKSAAEPGEWGKISVPGHIELAGGGKYGAPQYINSSYPWDGISGAKPGALPEENPVGRYEKRIFIPKDWTRAFLRFDGVEVALMLYVNGEFVGYSEDSFTPAEFDLTPFARFGQENELRVDVFRFTTASWLEDQDFWRFFGIFRPVALYTTPKTHIFDAHVSASLSDDFSCGGITAKITLAGEQKGCIIMRAAGGETRAEIASESVALTLSVDSPRLWSAEDPTLYECALELYDENGALLEKTSVKTGFRRFELKNGIMLLNGRRIIFNGVNRHEWSARNGRAVSVEETRADIINMKQNNINAVRTCHYPNRTELYDLCDEYGLYVIDETNLETHGTWQIEGQVRVTEDTLPGDGEAWRGAVLDRAKSMLMRDRNHPSILIWSCGNESMGGENIKAISDYFHGADKTRLVHFEADGLSKIPLESPFAHWRELEISDMVSKMYWPAAKIDNYLLRHTDKPFILCEYAHSMGNSTGALHKYTDLLDKYEQYQGGFIWDYIDQALYAKIPNGEGEYPAYGGDFCDRPNDYSFCADGIVFFDRKNSPKMQEVRACYQPFEISVSKTCATIKNRLLFTDLSEFALSFTLALDGAEAESVTLERACAPGGSVQVPLPFSLLGEGENAVTVRVTLKRDAAWAKAGHEIAFGQGVFGEYAPREKPKSPISLINGDMTLGVTTLGVTTLGVTTEGVTPRETSALMSKYPAGLVSYKKKGGMELIIERPRPSLWRAPTENDTAWQEPYEYAKFSTVKYAKPWLEGVDAGLDFASFTLSYALAWSGEKDLELKYEISGDGSVTLKLKWLGESCFVPEFGVLFTLPAELNEAEYYGMGPQECYCDRETGARLGLHKFSVEENVTKYVMPEECGNRTRVRYARLLDKNGRGVRFTSQSAGGMEFSALPYTPEQLESAKHIYELPAYTKTIVRCSLKQMGVAGDNTWGARPHEEYYVKIEKGTEFAVKMEVEE